MIFTAQSGLTDQSRLAEFADWYVEHLNIMRTVKGVDSAQRFITQTAGWSPSLAMYTIESAEVFTDPYYQSIRGMGPWVPLIDKRFYRRNLFQGCDQAPRVKQDEVLLISDPDRPADFNFPLGKQFTWVESVGLDKSIPCRGILVIDASQLNEIPQQLIADSTIAVYRPVGPLI